MDEIALKKGHGDFVVCQNPEDLTIEEKRTMKHLFSCLPKLKTAYDLQ
jgi:hypothetical protein